MPGTESSQVLSTRWHGCCWRHGPGLFHEGFLHSLLGAAWGPSLHTFLAGALRAGSRGCGQSRARRPYL